MRIAPSPTPVANPETADQTEGNSSAPRLRRSASTLEEHRVERHDGEANRQARKRAEPDPALVKIEAALSRSWRDWAITDGDVRSVHEALGRMPPADYRAALHQLQREGRLERYLSEMTPELRNDFLVQAADKGVLRSEAPMTASGPHAPPDAPRRYVNEPHLPSALRRAIHEHCVEANRNYEAAYGAYLQRYEAALQAATSPSELRNLGAPLAPFHREPEPGVTVKHPEHREFTKDRLARTSLLTGKDGYLAAQQRLNALMGRQTAGTMELIGSTKLSAGVPSSAIELKAEDGKLTAKRTVSLGDPEFHYKRKEDLETRERSETFGTQGFSVTRAKDKFGVKIAGNGVAVKGSKLTLETGLGERKVGAPGVATAKLSAGQSVSVDPRAATSDVKMKAGSELTVRSFKIEAEFEGGFRAQGLSAEEAMNAVAPAGVGLFTQPPELKQGTPWAGLPSHRRERYERVGWTEAEWNQRLIVSKA